MSSEKEREANLQLTRAFLLDQIEAVKIDAGRASSDALGALDIAGDVDKVTREVKIEVWKTRILTVMNEYCWHLSMLLVVFLVSDIENKDEELTLRLLDLVKLSTSSQNKLVQMKTEQEIRLFTEEFYNKWDEIRRQIILQVKS